MDQPKVTIEQGTVRGSIGKDLRGNNFYKFQRIPYAKPPLGELRFKAPVPPEKWIGIFDATKEGDMSYSADPLQNNKIAGSENCLVLNVYTKELDGLKPVLFWIHGGGFVWGHGGEELYAPDFLITEDVVVVTINYRLGIFGFVSFEDSSLEIPGNAGLKDQVMALKWVQKNISKFGGDPNNVTIFGESAGGASVHLHILSPMSKGLFHKVIAQSGCALNPFLNGNRGIKRIAEAMGLDGTNERTVYNALMKKSKQEILDISAKMIDKMEANDYRPVAVVVEKNSNEAFLPDEPIKIILSGKFTQVPLMLGYTSKEGIIFELFKDKQPTEDISFEALIPHNFGYKSGSPESRKVAQQIKKFYFGEEEPSRDNLTKKYDILTDCHVLFGLYLTAMTHLSVSKTPIYFYRVSVETELNFFKKLLQCTTPGVSHLDEIGYLFKHFLTPEIKPGSIEDISLTKFVKLWTNFAKFGNPTPRQNDSLLNVTWKPVTGHNLGSLDIGKNLVFKTQNPEIKRIEFWKKLFAESPAGQIIDL